MSYTKVTDFAAKDALLSGNPSKIVKGTEIGAEFDAIVIADASNVKGPSSPSSTDNAIVRWDTTSGRLVQNSTAIIDDTGVLLVSGANLSVGGSPVALNRQIQPISASVAANALTIAASALSLEFRSTTLGSGTVTLVNGTPASLVVPASATLGTVSAVQSRLAVLALNNAGTIELAVINLSGGTDLTETGLISTTAISAAATSASVVYSTTARTSVAYRVIGYIESTQATAGTWATAPSTIQGAGGQAVTAMSSLGYGQTYQDVTASRAAATTYYNTTGKPISVMVQIANSAASGPFGATLTINGAIVNANFSIQQTGAGNYFVTPSGVVPPGGSYSLTGLLSTTISKWYELR